MQKNKKTDWFIFFQNACNGDDFRDKMPTLN
jgi:hypothetical protein